MNSPAAAAWAMQAGTSMVRKASGTSRTETWSLSVKVSSRSPSKASEPAGIEGHAPGPATCARPRDAQPVDQAGRNGGKQLARRVGRQADMAALGCGAVHRVAKPGDGGHADGLRQAEGHE